MICIQEFAALCESQMMHHIWWPQCALIPALRYYQIFIEDFFLHSIGSTKLVWCLTSICALQIGVRHLTRWEKFTTSLSPSSYNLYIPHLVSINWTSWTVSCHLFGASTQYAIFSSFPHSSWSEYTMIDQHAILECYPGLAQTIPCFHICVMIHFNTNRHKSSYRHTFSIMNTLSPVSGSHTILYHLAWTRYPKKKAFTPPFVFPTSSCSYFQLF